MTSKHVAHQGLGRFEGLRDVGVEGLLVAEHFELHEPVSVEQLAGEPARAHRALRVVAARGIGEDREPLRRQMVEQVRLPGILADVRAADGHGDDLGAARLDRGARFLEVPVLAGADEQAGAVFGCRRRSGAARPGRRPRPCARRWTVDSWAVTFPVFSGVPGQAAYPPPPMAWTISTRSPSASACSA